jgi:hypothetical protein
MSERNARLKVVDDAWIEEDKRALTHDQLLEEFFVRIGRLNAAREAIERQSAQNEEARLRLREDMLKRFAQIREDDGLIRLLLPDTSDPVQKLIDSAMDFFIQLQVVAEQSPAFRSELGGLATLLAINPVIVKSALAGVTFPLQDKINQLAAFATERDQSTKSHNSVEDDRREDDKNPNNNPA